MLAALARSRCTSLLHAISVNPSASLPTCASRALSSQPTPTSTKVPSTGSKPIQAQWGKSSRRQPVTGEVWGVMKESASGALALANKSPEELWQGRESTLVAKLPKPQGPYDGRSAWVMHGDVAGALTRLNRIIMTNRVVPELRQHARHERAGAKRNRLTSERWRRRFAHEVRMKVKLVQEIRARGA